MMLVLWASLGLGWELVQLILMMLVLWGLSDAEHLICLMRPCSTSAHNACPLYFGLDSFRELGQLMLIMLVRCVMWLAELGRLMLIMLVLWASSGLG